MGAHNYNFSSRGPDTHGKKKINKQTNKHKEVNQVQTFRVFFLNLSFVNGLNTADLFIAQLLYLLYIVSPFFNYNYFLFQTKKRKCDILFVLQQSLPQEPETGRISEFEDRLAYTEKSYLEKQNKIRILKGNQPKELTLLLLKA